MNVGKQPLILIVDDDKHVLRTLGDYLAFEGYEIARATAAEAALEKLGSMVPDLVILDISMPGIGGVGFLKEISSADGKTKYPVLVLTARAVMEKFFDEIEVDGFVAKPCTENTLLTTIRDILSKRNAQARQSGAAPREILLGEDDPEVASNVTAALERAGYRCNVVATGPNVFQVATDRKPDAVLIKELLPKTSGRVVASLLKATPVTADIPIILYDPTQTADDTRKFRRSAPGGVARYLKTGEATLLVQAVDDVLA